MLKTSLDDRDRRERSTVIRTACISSRKVAKDDEAPTTENQLNNEDLQRNKQILLLKQIIERDFAQTTENKDIDEELVEMEALSKQRRSDEIPRRSTDLSDIASRSTRASTSDADFFEEEEKKQELREEENKKQVFTTSRENGQVIQARKKASFNDVAPDDVVGFPTLDVLEGEDPEKSSHAKKLRKRVALLLSKKNFHYAWLHVCWFSLISLVGAIFCFCIEKYCGTQAKFVDALFTTVSAVSATGLSSVDISLWKPASQVVVLIVMSVSGTAIDSAMPLLLRLFVWPRLYKTPHMLQEESATTSRPSSDARESEALQVEKEVQALYSTKRAEVESRSAKVMLVVIVGYIVVLLGTSFLGIGVYYTIVRNDSIDSGPGPWFFSIFHVFAAFNNAGFSLLSNNCVSMAKDSFPLFVTMALVLLGNTSYPVGIWCTVAILKKLKCSTEIRTILTDVLTYPRKFLTMMFPKKYTLYILLITTTAIEFGVMTGLDWDTLSYLSPWHRLVNTLFQSISTRTAGFNSFDISALNPGVKVLIVAMMYIAALPVAVSLRDTNLLVGAWHPDSSPKANRVLTQLKRLLIFDMTWVFVPWFLICCIEAHNIDNDQNFSEFKILFEIASSYGTVGLSLGYPGTAYSFSGSLSTASKVLLILVMMAGRHRGFPDKIDLAVQPSPYFVQRTYEVRSRAERRV